MKSFILILTACFAFLNSFGLKAKLDENLLSARNQPTTANLVTMSMAKLRNRDVSDWYVEKFIGKIIKFDSNMNDGLQDCFMENFNKIASNPVGRVLLFRLLIETKIESNDTTRERLKQITIKNIKIEDARANEIIDLGFGFHEDYGIISFTDTTTKPCVIKTKKHWFRETTYKLKKEKIDNIDINLFHEMCHWFHALSNHERKRLEGNYQEYDVFSSEIGKYYYQNIIYFGSVAINNSQAIVFDQNNEANLLFQTRNATISFEEMRTIYGSCQAVKNYQEGDDLCENLYRKSLGVCLRFGHDSQKRIENKIEGTYIPDSRILSKIINTVYDNYSFY